MLNETYIPTYKLIITQAISLAFLFGKSTIVNSFRRNYDTAFKFKFMEWNIEIMLPFHQKRQN